MIKPCRLSTSIIAVIIPVACKKEDRRSHRGYEGSASNTSSIRLVSPTNRPSASPSDIQEGRNLGMITLDTHLMKPREPRTIEPDEALEKSPDQVVMKGKAHLHGLQAAASSDPRSAAPAGTSSCSNGHDQAVSNLLRLF